MDISSSHGIDVEKSFILVFYAAVFFGGGKYVVRSSSKVS